MECDLETSIPDWLIDYPETESVLAELGLEVSCGGKSLEYVCRERGLDPLSVLDRLRAVIRSTRRDET